MSGNIAEFETDKSTKLSGVYRHKDTGIEVKLRTQPKLGTPLINAYIKMGYEYVGPLPSVIPDIAPADKDEYTESETKSGAIQYRRNGKLISKDKYENR